MRDNYNRLYELYDFINELYMHRFSGMTYADIMMRFGWNRKTTERMLNVVQNVMGPALVREHVGDGTNKKAYRLNCVSVASLPPNFVTNDELVALTAATDFSQLNDDIAPHLRRLNAKLSRISRQNAGDFDDMILASGTAATPRPHIKNNPVIMQQLQNAVLGCHVISMMYKGKKHRCCPLGFLYGLHNNYLVAENAHYKNIQANYILSEISKVKIHDEQFDAHQFDIHEYAKRSFGVYQNGFVGGYDVKWQVSRKAAADAKRYVFHPEQKIIENPDGTLTVSFHADGLREMVWHLFTWGGEVIPIAPKELVDEYKKYIKLATDSIDNNQ